MEKQENNKGHFSFKLSTPKRSVYSFILLILSLSFTYIQAIGYLIPGFQSIDNLKPESISINDIGLIWIPILSYILVSLNICLFINIFKKLRKFNETSGFHGDGIIDNLALGLIVGLAVGLAFALLVGEFFDNYIGGFISGSIFGLTIGFGLGLMFALIYGIPIEMKKD